MRKIALFNNSSAQIERVYALGRRQHLATLADLYPTVVGDENFQDHAANLKGVEAVFSTWGMWPLTPAQLDALPDLKIVLYGAGSVQRFAPSLLERGVRVVSAWGANAVPVAEFAFGQILLSNKGFFRNTSHYHGMRTRKEAFVGLGNFGVAAGVLGAGQVGRNLIRMLKTTALDVIVWDPFLSSQHAQTLGVEKAETLYEVFARSRVVSNHLADLPATRGLITGGLIESMPPDATFINTGRGATVVEPEMIDVLRRRPDLMALLDVTFPEPAPPDSPLFELPNVRLSTHIAGAVGLEVVRLADTMIEEFLAWDKGDSLRYEVTSEMLASMA